MMMRRTRLSLPVLLLTGTLALTACGAGADGPGTTSAGSSATTSASSADSSSPHNTADVTFAAGMVPHHAQAIEMADLALTKASSAQVKSLAERIKAAQDPEITVMSSWLKGWGQPVPTTGSDGMDGMAGMDHGEADGMMTDQEMADLGDASGTAFDRLWLQQMTKHHEGAVAMAKVELSDGAYPAAKALAQSVIDGQSKEISEMARMLKTLG